MANRYLSCFRGRVGLAGILRAIGVAGGDEVLTQAFTCVAVPEGIIAAGGTPVYADLRENSVTVDPEDIARKITARTKAIVVQHTFGYAGPIAEVAEIADSKGIALIEDCCHSYRTEVDGSAIGSFGVAAFYSCEWGKPLACGVGGAVMVNDSRIRNELEDWHKSLRAPGWSRCFRMELQYLAFSVLYRPSTYWWVRSAFRRFSRAGAAEGNFNDVDKRDIAGDFGLDMCPLVARRFRRKLRSLDRVTRHSKRIVEAYRGWRLVDGIQRVAEDGMPGAVLARYPLWTDDKKSLVIAARAANIEVADWYTTPVHPLVGDAQIAVNYRPGSCPIAETACGRIVSLPTNLRVNAGFIERASSLFSLAPSGCK